MFIDLFTSESVSMHREQFSIEASKLDFKSFILKNKANNLKLNDLKKGLIPREYHAYCQTTEC